MFVSRTFSSILRTAHPSLTPLAPAAAAILPRAVSRTLTTSRTNMSAQTPYQIVATKEALGAIGPYSQATVHNGIAYVSGCIPFHPETVALVEGGIEAQTEQALKNLFAVVKAAGSDKSHILKTTVFMKDMNDFAKINAIYEREFAPYKPARSAVEVARLPKDVGVEIECICAVKSAL